MHEQLLHLGNFFKEQREGRGLSLKDVENEISIRAAYLEAIEAGQFGKLISPMYARGFIVKYALFLKVDGEQLLKQYPYVLQLLQPHAAQGDEFSFGIGSLEIRNPPSADVKWMPNFVWVILSVVVILGGWYLLRKLGIF